MKRIYYDLTLKNFDDYFYFRKNNRHLVKTIVFLYR